MIRVHCGWSGPGLDHVWVGGSGRERRWVCWRGSGKDILSFEVLEMDILCE